MRGRYDREYGQGRRGYPNPAPYGPTGAWPYPGYIADPFLLGFPSFAGGWGWGVAPFPPFGGGMYDREYHRPPEQSPTYGRDGDRAVRRYLRDRGYDEGYSIPPRGRGYDREIRRPSSRASSRSRYGRDYR